MNTAHIFARQPQTRRLLLPVLVAMALGGCATPEYVHKEVGQYDQRIAAMESWYNTITTGLDTQSKRLREIEMRMDHLEQASTSLDTRFGANEAVLQDTGRRVDQLAAELAGTNQKIAASQANAERGVQHIASLDTQLTETSQRLNGAMAVLASAREKIDAIEDGLLKASRASGAARVGAEEKAAPPAIVSVSVSTPPESTQIQTTKKSTEQPISPDSTGSLVAELDKKIEAQNGALMSADGRLASLESGFAATMQKNEAQDARLQAADEQIGMLRREIASVREKANANIEAITLVDNRVGEVNASLDEAHKRVEESEKVLAESGLRLTMVQEMVKGQSERLSRTELENDKISSTAREALERAREAGKLAEGKLVFETVLSDEITNFGFKDAKLNDAAKQQLNNFANKLKSENKGVFIEIQGYTDSLGSSAVNRRLSRDRAQAVRDYLNQEAGIPLHRLAVAAYGESKPIADNTTKEGRSRNRRVVLVVLE